MTKDFVMKQSASKNLVEMRKQEKIYFTVKDYDKAQAMRMMIEQQEMYEAEVQNGNLQLTLLKEMEKLIKLLAIEFAPTKEEAVEVDRSYVTVRPTRTADMHFRPPKPVMQNAAESARATCAGRAVPRAAR